MKKAFKIIYIIGFVVLFFGLFHLNYNFYYSPDIRHGIDYDIVNQLNYLEAELKEEQLGQRMQEYFPEGFIFINALYGLSWCEIGLNADENSDLSARAQNEALFALEQINSDMGKSSFHKELKPAYGVFYRGWQNYLLGKIIALQAGNADTALITEFRKNCNELALAFVDKNSPYLESYKKRAWPADNFVAIASLKLHDDLFEKKYADIIKTWVANVKINIEDANGMIAHSVDFNSGRTKFGSRGSSMSLILRFLHELDPEFALAQFELFRGNFAMDLLGLPGMREYKEDEENAGDIDSGPVIFGIGPVATVMSIGVYNIYGEHEMSEAVSQNVESWGIDLCFGDEKYYAFGLMPMGDAFIAWSRLTEPNKEILKLKEGNAEGPGSWRCIFQIISIALLALSFLPLWFWIKNGKKNHKK